MKTFDLKWILYWAGALLCSCTISEEIAPDKTGRRKTLVLFSSGLGTPFTKVSGEMGDVWEATDTVGVYMVSEGGKIPGSVVDGALNKPYRVSAPGTDMCELLPAADTIWYPIVGQVNFILYYPYTRAISGANYPVDLRDQSRQAAIDLMYAKTPSAYDQDTQTKVEVTFEHRLTKLVFLITKGPLIPSLDGLTFEIEGVSTQTTCNLSMGQLADAGLGGTGKLSAKVTPLSSSSVKAEAIVLPVKNINNTELSLLIKVGGSHYTATLPRSNNNPELKAGHLYTYNVYLNKAGAKLSGLTP
ncbi:MAG: fimbrillin family protein [Tannerellaceae bacterium]|jgi:endonuclease G|nr:fimbrillin family protein [Tannerellaceae bacterium]